MAGRFVAWVVAIVAFGVQAVTAQFFSYNVVSRPRDTSYRVISSEHFDVIYDASRPAEALAALRLLEEHYTPTRRLLRHRRSLRMPVVLNGYNDRSNGYVTPLPFKQEIEAVSIRGTALSPRHPSWLHTVVPHELVHAVHADVGRRFGLGSLVRIFAPDAARTLTLIAPPGISEGIAVFRESGITPGAGRLNHSFFTMRFRAAMASKKPWSLAQLVEAPAYTLPADRFYIGGAHLVNHLAARDSLDFFDRATQLNYQLPFLGYGIGFWHGTRRWPQKVYREFLDEVRFSEEERSTGKRSKPAVIAGETGAVHRFPHWLDEQTVVTFSRGYNRIGGFYACDVSSGEGCRLIREAAPVEDAYFSLSTDGNSIYYARYDQDPFVPGKAIARLYEVDAATGEKRRLTEHGRLFAPAESNEGGFWGVQNDGQGNQLVRLSAAGRLDTLSTLQHIRIQSVEPSPEGGRLLAVLNMRGRQGVFDVEVHAGGVELRPFLLFEEGSIYDASWSRDGRYVLFSADPSGTVDVYAYDVREDRLAQVTAAEYGAFEPALSPDGRSIAFVHYEHERYELAVEPFSFDAARALPVELVKAGLVQKADASSAEAGYGEPVDDRPYRAFSRLKPRMLFPIVRYDDILGFGGGLLLQGIDPLQRWMYTAASYVQHGRVWGRFEVRHAGAFLHYSASLFQRPSSALADVNGDNVEGARPVIRDRRGLEAGVRLPIVFERNVYLSAMTLSLNGLLQNEQYSTTDQRFISTRQEQITLRPALSAWYRLQSNQRDLAPSKGLTASLSTEIDVWQKYRIMDRAFIGRVQAFLPWLQRNNTGLIVRGKILSQNRGGIYNLKTFMPRGYQHRFLDRGTFAGYGFEFLQPIWYVDNGFFMVPLYFKALYGFGFAERLHAINGPMEGEHFDSAGLGLGLRFRIFYFFDFDLRFNASYRFGDDDWRFWLTG